MYARTFSAKTSVNLKINPRSHLSWNKGSRWGYIGRAAPLDELVKWSAIRNVTIHPIFCKFSFNIITTFFASHERHPAQRAASEYHSGIQRAHRADTSKTKPKPSYLRQGCHPVRNATPENNWRYSRASQSLLARRAEPSRRTLSPRNR